MEASGHRGLNRGAGKEVVRVVVQPVGGVLFTLKLVSDGHSIRRRILENESP